MTAAVRHEYGSPDVLKLREVDTPTPKDGQVLVRVRAAAVNTGDHILLHGRPWVVRLAGYGIVRPKIQILGGDVAGVVERVGKDVTRFRVGDEVFGDVNFGGWGSFAQYVCATEDALAPKPSSVSFENAAAAPMAGITALQALRKGRIQSGDRVLINGASGGVGTFAVQIAKAYGAEVTGVCSTRNVDQARRIGADHVIDYTREDFATRRQQYDLIIDVATKRSIRHHLGCLRPNGRYVVAGGGMACLLQAALLGPILPRLEGGRQVTTVMHRPGNEDLMLLRGWLETGAVVSAIDRCFELSELSRAMRYFGEGHAKAKVVITVRP